jgi:hypothetical protein
MSQEKYIGMDVHQATISGAVMEAGGKLIMECQSGWPRSLNQEFEFERNGSISNWICCNLCASKRDASYWWKATSMLP